MKRYLFLIPVLALAFAFAADAGRDRHDRGDRHHRHGHNMEIEVENFNHARIGNKVKANTNTGDNHATSNRRIGRIDTGMALSTAMSENQANRNSTDILGRWRTDVEVENRNGAMVKNYVEANANTGNNVANDNGEETVRKEGSHYYGYYNHYYSYETFADGRGVINTGAADSAASAFNVLNDNMTVIK